MFVPTATRALEWEEWFIADDDHAFTFPGTTASLAIGGTVVALDGLASLMTLLPLPQW